MTSLIMLSKISIKCQYCQIWCDFYIYLKEFPCENGYSIDKVYHTR